MRTDRFAWLALALVACNPPVIPHAMDPDSTWIDAYRDDTGTIVVHDAGHDAFVTDSSFDAAIDAPGIDVGSADAGPPLAIRLDGVLDDTWWMTAGSRINNMTTVVTPYDGDTLTALYYGRDQDWLYLGFEGTLVSSDAVVFYVDTHFGDGVPLSTGLGDTTNHVNSVLSLQITGTAEFQPEFGFGTSALPHGTTQGDSTLGWRMLAPNPSRFGDVLTNTRSICSMTGCETAILLAQIGEMPGTYLQFIVRLGRPGVGFSNQTFPVADSATPETVNVAISVPAAM